MIQVTVSIGQRDEKGFSFFNLKDVDHFSSFRPTVTLLLNSYISTDF